MDIWRLEVFVISRRWAEKYQRYIQINSQFKPVLTTEPLQPTQVQRPPSQPNPAHAGGMDSKFPEHAHLPHSASSAAVAAAKSQQQQQMQHREALRLALGSILTPVSTYPVNPSSWLARTLTQTPVAQETPPVFLRIAFVLGDGKPEPFCHAITVLSSNGWSCVRSADSCWYPAYRSIFPLRTWTKLFRISSSPPSISVSRASVSATAVEVGKNCEYRVAHNQSSPLMFGLDRLRRPTRPQIAPKIPRRAPHIHHPVLVRGLGARAQQVRYPSHQTSSRCHQQQLVHRRTSPSKGRCRGTPIQKRRLLCQEAVVTSMKVKAKYPILVVRR